MKNKIPLIRKRNGFLLTLLIAVGSFLIISSCSNIKALSGPECYQLNELKIKKKWVDNGFTKPGSEEIILIEFIPDNNVVNDKFDLHAQLISYNKKTKKSAVIIGSLIKNILRDDIKCKIDSPKLLYGKNYLAIDSLYILEPGGDKLKKFKYIGLNPVKSNSTENAMAFDCSIQGGSETNKVVQTWPCPEYCCPGKNCPYN